MSAVTKMDAAEQHAASAIVTPMDMVNRAVVSGASMDVLEKLMLLQERWEASQARKAFDAAVADAKAEIPAIVRNKSGHNDKRYADFAAIAGVVDPIISKFGLSYRFRTQQNDRIHVTCVLSHKAGHFEETTLAGPADGSGNKNAIQAIGSTLTYLQRYSLIQALGLAVADDDDGKQAANVEKITQAQADNLIELLEANGRGRAKFLRWAKVERIEDIPAAFYQNCVDGITYKAPQA
jgi:hypothetical protein